MAKQKGTKYRGTAGNVTFYCWRGIWCMRMKSSLSKERVSTDPAYQPLMEDAAVMAAASSLASAIHKQLPKVKDGRGRFRKLVGVVKAMLRAGMSRDEIVQSLLVPPKAKRNAREHGDHGEPRGTRGLERKLLRALRGTPCSVTT